ncbi:MAG: GNAT family N-acetyltransferase [Synechocystis sp.]|nr:GNAT family N-acetyltransferase [Synechocystis sp.]
MVVPVPKQTRSIAIRLATLDDISALATLLVKSFHPPQGWLLWSYPFLRLGISEDLRLRLRNDDGHYRCLIAVALDNQEIIGTAEIALKPWFYRPKTTAYISNLAVSPHHRRLGVAKQLLQRCQTVAEQWHCQRVSLHVLENNLAAQGLYQGAGFQCQGIEWSWQSWLWQKPRRLLWEKTLAVEISCPPPIKQVP